PRTFGCLDDQAEGFLICLQPGSNLRILFLCPWLLPRALQLIIHFVLLLKGSPFTDEVGEILPALRRCLNAHPLEKCSRHGRPFGMGTKSLPDKDIGIVCRCHTFL